MTRKPDPIDVHVGSRVRLRRTLLGMSQEALGQRLGLTFQQIQKYEKGTNRIGSSRLFRLGVILGVEVSYFYADMLGELLADIAGSPGIPASYTPPENTESDALARRETLELVRKWYVLPPSMRKRFLAVIRAIADGATTAALITEQGDGDG